MKKFFTAAIILSILALTLAGCVAGENLGKQPGDTANNGGQNIESTHEIEAAPNASLGKYQIENFAWSDYEDGGFWVYAINKENEKSGFLCLDMELNPLLWLD